MRLYSSCSLPGPLLAAPACRPAWPLQAVVGPASASSLQPARHFTLLFADVSSAGCCPIRFRASGPRSPDALGSMLLLTSNLPTRHVTGAGLMPPPTPHPRLGLAQRRGGKP